MQNKSIEQATHDELLSEILLTSSDQTIENRFVSTTDSSSEAQCGGRCGTGTCKTFV